MSNQVIMWKWISVNKPYNINISVRIIILAKRFVFTGNSNLSIILYFILISNRLIKNSCLLHRIQFSARGFNLDLHQKLFNNLLPPAAWGSVEQLLAFVGYKWAIRFPHTIIVSLNKQKKKIRCKTGWLKEASARVINWDKFIKRIEFQTR